MNYRRVINETGKNRSSWKWM